MEKLTNIGKFLDSTYLKTANESSISELKNQEIVISFIEEAIKNKYACIMIRPKYVQLACEKIQFCNSELKVGTVIDFPLGSSDTHIKIKEAEDAIENGAYELDFVCDYNAFKRKNLKKFDSDILKGTKICLKNSRIVKWIIETGALSRDEIRMITKRIHNIAQLNFPNNMKNIFIKTSTGYYGGMGATIKDVKLIKSQTKDLRIKASGGISRCKDAIKMISAGADRIGTSKAQIILQEQLNFLNES